MSTGHIELERAVSSISVGNRHRTDLGDIDGLAASIARDGLLQPLTITPEGVLVCGRRRLAAIQQLGWRTVNVWVRSGISDRLGHLLAEQDDNVLHKSLTPLEAAALYRELKALLAEDAARRQAATRFSSDRQPGDETSEDGGANLAPPSAPSGKRRAQAAAMIPGAPKHATLDKIEFIQDAATRTDLPESVRAEIAEALAQVEAGEPVHPLYERVRARIDQADAGRDADLDQLAQEALARAQAAAPKKRKQTAAVAGPMVWTTRSFVVIWGELDGWWTHYDPAQLAAELTDEQIELFLTIATATAEFATALQQARTAPDDTAPVTDTIPAADAGAGEDAVGVRHLRAL